MPDHEGEKKGEEFDTSLHAYKDGREDDLEHDPAMTGDREGDAPFQQPEEGKQDAPAKH